MKTIDSTTGFPPDLFEATRWSVVVAAADSGLGSDCQLALSELCQTYWFPVYAYLRRKGYGKPQAEDLAQGFFARLLEKKSYAAADPDRGRFRAFLITSLKNFLHNAHDREQALKRGSGIKPIELDAGQGEERYALVAQAGDESMMFDREWAQSVVKTTLARLRDEYVADGRHALFNHLHNSIVNPGRQRSQAEMARELKMSEGAVKSALQRLRKRFRWLLRNEVAQTTSSPAEVDGEIRYLLTCLRDPAGHEDFRNGECKGGAG